MGIEDDFYATVKLTSGEEIFAKIAASEEDNRTMLIVQSPIIISEINVYAPFTSPTVSYTEK